MENQYSYNMMINCRKFNALSAKKLSALNALILFTQVRHVKAKSIKSIKSGLNQTMKLLDNARIATLGLRSTVDALT
jgi:hypothetical protein